MRRNSLANANGFANEIAKISSSLRKFLANRSLRQNSLANANAMAWCSWGLATSKGRAQFLLAPALQISFEPGFGAYQRFGAETKSSLCQDVLLISAVLRVRGRFQSPRQTPGTRQTPVETLSLATIQGFFFGKPTELTKSLENTEKITKKNKEIPCLYTSPEVQTLRQKYLSTAGNFMTTDRSTKKAQKSKKIPRKIHPGICSKKIPSDFCRSLF